MHILAYEQALGLGVWGFFGLPIILRAWHTVTKLDEKMQSFS